MLLETTFDEVAPTPCSQPSELTPTVMLPGSELRRCAGWQAEWSENGRQDRKAKQGRLAVDLWDCSALANHLLALAYRRKLEFRRHRGNQSLELFRRYHPVRLRIGRWMQLGNRNLCLGTEEQSI